MNIQNFVLFICTSLCKNKTLSTKKMMYVIGNTIHVYCEQLQNLIIPNSRETGHSSEASIRTLINSHEIRPTSWKPKVHCHVYKSMPPVCTRDKRKQCTVSTFCLFYLF